MMNSVLIVDDDPVFREVLAALFQRRYPGLRVLTAMNGKEGVASLTTDQSNLALIICDLYMPDIDGIEFMRELQDRKCRTPIILVSGAAAAIMNAASVLATAGGLNVIAKLTKPLNYEHFGKAVDQVLKA